MIAFKLGLNLFQIKTINKMKTTEITLIAFITLVIVACSATKKSTTSSSSVTPVSANAPTSSISSLLLPKSVGMHAPREEELSAMQVQYKDLTLDRLKTGHSIYTQGACINCHGAVNIYKYTELQWTNIIDDMALRARISYIDKDAVYKYVLAIKATQPK